MIERVLADDFGGTVEVSWRPEGLRFALTAPLGRDDATI
jgi:hypothetical protein